MGVVQRRFYTMEGNHSTELNDLRYSLIWICDAWMSFVNSLIHLKETYQSWVIIGWGIPGSARAFKELWVLGKKSGLTPECNGLYVGYNSAILLGMLEGGHHRYPSRLALCQNYQPKHTWVSGLSRFSMVAFCAFFSSFSTLFFDDILFL